MRFLPTLIDRKGLTRRRRGLWLCFGCTLLVLWLSSTLLSRSFPALYAAPLPTLMAATPTNVAQGKPATQSSVYPSPPGCFGADKAVDGNTSGVNLDCHMSHTDTNAQAWWQVDLQAPYLISSIDLWNRTDCCADRLTNFDLLVSQDGQNWTKFYYPGTAPRTTNFPINAVARYVKVQLRGTNSLQLAEVQVWDTPVLLEVSGNNRVITPNDTTPSAADNTDLGAMTPNGTLSKAFVLRNTGQTNLTVSGITLSDNSFTLVNPPSFPLILAPNSTQAITVQFQQATLGTRTATLTITSNDAALPNYAFTLQGSVANAAAALDFDGVDDYVEIPNATALNQYVTTGELTVEFWVKPQLNPGLSTLVSKRPATDDGGFVIEADASTLNFKYWLHTSANWQALLVAYTPNVWQHIAFVAQAGKAMRVYQNGVLQGTLSLAGIPTFTPTTAALRLMQDTVSWSGPAKGQMDELHIWSRALSQSEIQARLNCQLGDTPTGLLAHYTFNHGLAATNNSGVTTLSDASGHHNNGTLSNFALTGSASNWVAPGGVPSDSVCKTNPTLVVQPDGVSLLNGNQINVPILFTNNNNAIASLGFALDYQESCLSFDATDSDNNSVPDAITGLPAAFVPSISHQPSKRDGELEIALYDDSNPITSLPDGPLFTVQFTVQAACLPTAGVPTPVAVNFGQHPAPSFGDPTGVDVVGIATGAMLTLQPAAPTAIALSNSSVAENSPLNTTVGLFSTTDPTAGDSHTYTLVSGAGDTDNGNFVIVGNLLQTAALFDYETQPSQAIRVRTTDNSGNFFEQSFTITVTDVDESPVAVDDLVDPRTTVFLGGQSGAIDVLANDTPTIGTLTVASVTQPATGGGSVTNNTSNVSYTAPNSNGSATFTYQATNGSATSNSATVSLRYVANDQRGDCNGNGTVAAADFIGVVLEIFDANNTLHQGKPAWWLSYTGDYAGSPRGCDANGSGNGAAYTNNSVTAADITCAVLIFFGHPCGATVQAADRLATTHLAVADQQASPGRTTTLTVTLNTGGNAIAAATFALGLDPALLPFDPTDGDQDGLPDAITLHTPAGMSNAATWNAERQRLEVAIFGTSVPLPTLTDGPLATVTLTVANNTTATSTPLPLDLVSFSDPDGNDLPATDQDGTLTITGNPATAKAIFLPLVVR